MKTTVYSTTTCPYCVMLTRWLDDRGIEYTEHKVDVNPFAAQSLVLHSNQRSVPFTIIEHKDKTVDKILGFDRPALEKVYGKASN